MSSNTLDSLLNLTYQELHPIFCINANAQNKVILQYITDNIKNKTTNCKTESFIIEKNFNYQILYPLLLIDSLFEETVHIQLQYKTKPNAKDLEELYKLIPLIQNQHKIIIISETINYKDAKSNFFNNKIPIFLIQEQDIHIIINDILKSNFISITSGALQLLYSYNQNNPTAIIQETKKLSLYFQTKHTITDKNIIDIIQKDNQYTVYNLSNNYLNGNLKQSLIILDKLTQNSDTYILINWMFHEDIKKLIKLKQMLKDNINIKTGMKQLGIWGDSEKYIPIALNKLSYQTLINILSKIALLDLSIKGVLNNDVQPQFISIIKLFCSN